MGLFDDVTKKGGDLLSGLTDSKSKLIGTALQVIMGKFGGLDGLVQSFQKKGLGDIVSSWIGTGSNKPISPDQLKQGLGQENVREIAQKTGESESSVLSQLSGLMPQVVDKLTPGGKIPGGNLLEQGLDLIRKKAV
jgi:uncharacterized protein YidB (DUF937 family)